MNMNTSIKDLAEEELKSFMMYNDMAEELDNEGHHGEASILRDIAHEEMTHSRHLEEIYKHMNDD